ncbi:MAG TPA: oligopeptide:H+ symporter [Caulobacter sp.]|nr:oligopeptide:H+ symporter [Caulobacter sp.]
MNIVIALGILVTLATGIPVLLQMRAHPKGLFILFFAEMWERFSYYGMRGILIFYLTQHFLFKDDYASGLYGSYTSLVYLLPLLGGILADRYIGTRKAIAFGALLLVAGHGMMAIEGQPAKQTLNYQGAAYEMQVEGRGSDRKVCIQVGQGCHAFGAGENGALVIKDLPAASPLPASLPQGSYEMKETRDATYVNIFFLAISLIIMGVGFLKPNISTIVGQLYPEGDPRRDPGFTLYYYGINMGAFWASVLCGYLGQTYGWGWGFGLAGAGMLLGYLAFVLGKPLLEGHGEPPNPVSLAKPVVGPLNQEGLIYIGGILGVGLVWMLVQSNAIVGLVLSLSIVASLIAIVLIIAFVCKTWVQRQRMMLAMILIFGAVVFFTLFEQAGTSLNLFADRNVDLSLISSPFTLDLFGQSFFFGTRDMVLAAGVPDNVRWIDMGITAAQTQSFNAGFILIFAPVFAAMWLFLGKHNRDPNPVMKFGLGLVQVGLGFMVIVWGAGMANSAYQMPLIMLGVLYLLHTTGELFLSPVGLSEITKLSMPSVVSFMMAVWFLSSSIAQYVGGIIAGAMGTETVGGQVLDPKGALATSLDGFGKLGWAGIGVGVFFILISFLVKKWGHVGVDGTPHAEIDGDRQSMPH